MNQLAENAGRESRRDGGWGWVGAAWKSLAPGGRKVPFADLSQGGIAGASLYGGGLGGYGGGWGGRSPGATYDYGAAAGELVENRVVAACVNAIAQALSDAPPYLEKRDGNGWAKVASHPVIELLNAPNGYYGSPHLWSATAASECTTGQAFWRIEKNRAGVPAELWWEDARRFRALGNAEQFISGYRFQTERGGWVDLDNDEVIHFRHTLNPYNPREGRTPLETGLRQVALDNGIASYSGSILRNSGVMSLLISAKDATAGAQIAPSQIQEFVDKLKQRLFGDGAGGIAGLNLPIDVQKMSYSPDEMAVDKLTSYAEASICALLGVDPMVCGLGSGTQQRTYANMGEALNDFWERRIIPAKNRHSAELGAQLLPLYGLDAKDYRIAWDYSKVAALQENEDGKHARVRADYQAGLLDLYDAQTALGIGTDESKKGVFYGKDDKGEAGHAAKYRPDQRREHGRFADEGRGRNKVRVEISPLARERVRQIQIRNASALAELITILELAPTAEDLAKMKLQHWKPAGNTVTLRTHDGRVFNDRARRETPNDTLSNQERGHLGEEIVSRHLLDQGAVWSLTRKDSANAAIDLVALEKSGIVALLEVKTGKVNASATEWKVSPGYNEDEKRARQSMSDEQKRAYDSYRISQALRRKESLREELKKNIQDNHSVTGVSLETIGVIINTSAQTADIHRLNGVHKERLTWASPRVQDAYQRSISYDLR